MAQKGLLSITTKRARKGGMETAMSITDGKSVPELMAMREEVEAALRDAREERIDALRQQAQALADDDKVSLEVFVRQNLLGEGKASRMQSSRPRRNVMQARYVDPNDPSKTWSGHGKRPGWLEKALDEGWSLETLAVDQPASSMRQASA